LDPGPDLEFPRVKDLLDRYQAQAKTEGLDPLGYGMVPTAYAQVQALGEAVAATGSLDQDKIAAYMHSQPIHTVWGNIPSVPMANGARGACLSSNITALRPRRSSNSPIRQKRPCSIPPLSIGRADLSLCRGAEMIRSRERSLR